MVYVSGDVWNDGIRATRIRGVYSVLGFAMFVMLTCFVWRSKSWKIGEISSNGSRCEKYQWYNGSKQ